MKLFYIAFFVFVFMFEVVYALDCQIYESGAKACNVNFDPTYKSPYGSVTRTISNLNPSAGEEIVITYIAIPNDNYERVWIGLDDYYPLWTIKECETHSGGLLADLTQGENIYKCTLIAPSESVTGIVEGSYAVGSKGDYDIAIPFPRVLINVAGGGPISCIGVEDCNDNNDCTIDKCIDHKCQYEESKEEECKKTQDLTWVLIIGAVIVAIIFLGRRKR